MRKFLLALLVLFCVVAAGVEAWLLLGHVGDDDAPDPAPSTGVTASSTPTAEPPAFDTSRYSIDDPTSIWVVANKRRPLDPLDWTPPDLVPVPVPTSGTPMLRAEAADALLRMFADFRAETGLELMSVSSFRSHAIQANVYNGWVARVGQAQADRQSARPGHSEHQTGLSMDINDHPASCPSADQAACFAATPHYRWLLGNAYRYGWIERYPQGKESVTGYMWESWHWRYVGVDLALEMHERAAGGALTLEEFFDLPPAPDYA